MPFLVEEDESFARCCFIHQQMQRGQILVPVRADYDKPLCLFTTDKIEKSASDA
jgi:hypothetical protein